MCRKAVGPWGPEMWLSAWASVATGEVMGEADGGQLPQWEVPKQTGPRPCAGLPPLPDLLLPPLRPWRLP